MKMLLTVQCVSIPDLFQPGACSLWYRDSGILVDSKHCFPEAGFILFCSSFAKKVGSKLWFNMYLINTSLNELKLAPQKSQLL